MTLVPYPHGWWSERPVPVQRCLVPHAAPSLAVPCQWVGLTWSSAESCERWAAESSTNLGFLTLWTFLHLFSFLSPKTLLLFLLFCMVLILLFPSLFPLAVSSLFLILGRACKPFDLTVVWVRESCNQSVLILAKASSFYLLSSQSLAGPSGQPRESLRWLETKLEFLQQSCQSWQVARDLEQ